jgi:hypothetical protein
MGVGDSRSGDGWMRRNIDAAAAEQGIVDRSPNSASSKSFTFRLRGCSAPDSFLPPGCGFGPRGAKPKAVPFFRLPRQAELFCRGCTLCLRVSRRPPAIDPTQHAALGARFDFNEGCRVRLPEAARH